MNQSTGWQESIRNRPEMYLQTIDWSGVKEAVHQLVDELTRETGAKKIDTIFSDERRVKTSLTNCRKGLQSGWEQYSARFKPWNKTEFHLLNVISSKSIVEHFAEDGNSIGKLEFDRGVLMSEEKPGLEVPFRIDFSFRFFREIGNVELPAKCV